MESLEPLVINERASERAAELGQPAVRQGEAPLSTLWAPLIVGGEATGVVSVQNLDREHAFRPGDVSLLQTLAASLSVSLETGRLIAETRRRADEMSALADMAAEISATLDVGAVLDEMIARITVLLDGDTTAVFLRESEGTFKAIAARGSGRGRDPRGHDRRGRGHHRGRDRGPAGRVRQQRPHGPADGRTSPAPRTTSRSGSWSRR